MTNKQAPAVELPGTLYRRSGSVNWWYGVTVPADLADLPQYLNDNGKPSKWAFRRSLGTSDRAEAERLALGVLQKLQDQWSLERRQADPVRVSALSPSVVSQLAEYIRFCVFNADDIRRDSPYAARRVAVIRDLAAGATTRDKASADLEAPLGAYLDDQGAEGLEGWNLDRDSQAGKALARRNHEAVLQDAQAAANWLGVSYDWSQPEARPHLLKLLEAKRKALADLKERDRGEAVETPPEPVQVLEGATLPTEGRKPGQPIDILKASPSEVFLRDVFEDWAQHGKAGRKPYPEKTIAKYRRALGWFEKHSKNPSMAAIDRACGVELQRKLLAVEGPEGMTAASIRDTIINLGTLVNHYSQVTGKVQASLWARITLKLDTGPASTRDEWTEDELKKLFGLPVWQRYELPKGKNAGLDAAYWVPLLGLFTGARITELAQLRVDDLEEVDGVWYLRMEETTEGQSLKASASRRTIPLAAGLIDLGLIEYREAIKAMGQGWLFPGITKSAQNNAGGGVSKWFSTLKIGEGFRDDVVFHSLRGSLNTALARTGKDVALRCKYIGQKPEGGVNVSSYLKLKPRDLIPLAESISYPFLNLPKVYTAPAWYPGWKKRLQ